MFDRTLSLFGWSVVVILAVQTLPVSKLAMNPHSVVIEGEQVVVIRSYPLDAISVPRPIMSYVETVKPLTQSHNGGHPCIDAAGPFPYSRDEAGGGKWNIAWAADCLSDPIGFTWSARWTWHIGVLQMGPVSLTEVFLK